ncbi:hypothetical protein YC2023_101058 [Brassica napus]
METREPMKNKGVRFVKNGAGVVCRIQEDSLYELKVKDFRDCLKCNAEYNNHPSKFTNFFTWGHSLTAGKTVAVGKVTALSGASSSA